MSAPKPAAGAQFLALPAPPQRLTPAQLFTALGEKHLPTTQQEKVITAPLKPTLVVAGAGSGKTATMSARVTYLVASGQVDPSQVLGLTFTRKATHELRERIENRLGQLYRYPGGHRQVLVLMLLPRYLAAYPQLTVHLQLVGLALQVAARIKTSQQWRGRLP